MRIRGWFLLYPLLLIISTALRAQVLIGPVVGTGVSWVSFHEKESRRFYKQTPVPGFMAGVDVSFLVRKSFFLHTALIYSSKGKNLSSNQSPDLRQKEVFNHIDMPVLFTHEFKIKVGRNKIVKWYGGLGPNISYWLGGHGSLNTAQLLEDGLPPLKYSITFKEQESYPGNVIPVHEANRLQLGLNLSTGVVFEPMGYQRFHFNVRYELGHSYLTRNGPTIFPGVNDYSDDVKARNMGFRLSLSYLVDLKTSERKKGKSTIDRHIQNKKK